MAYGSLLTDSYWKTFIDDNRLFEFSMTSLHTQKALSVVAFWN